MIARKRFYHCKKIPNAESGVVLFEPPIEKYENYQPLSGYIDTLTYGEQINYKWRLQVAVRGNEKEYHEGDFMYLDEATPNINSETYENGQGANARVTAVKIGYKAIIVELERIIERVY